MALSGSVTTSSSSSRSVTLNWTATQSITNNTSTISWTLVGSGSASGWVRVSELRVTIDGSQVYYRDSSNHTNCYNGTTLVSGSTTVSHSSDGTKSVTIKVEAGIYQWTINCSGSSTFTLNTIARASSITTASSITLGNACSIAWTPASTSFYYKIKFTLGSWNYTTAAIHPNTTSSYTYSSYTIPLTVANQLPSATSGTMTAYLYTYSSSACSTQIGSTSSKTFIVSVPSSVIPTISNVSASIVNSNSTINGWGIAVAGYTKVKIAATASGSYSSTIASFTISGGYSTTQSGTSLSYTGGAIAASSSNVSKTFTVKATDSRGRSSSTTTTSAITFYGYAKPSISSIAAERSTADSTKVIVKANWAFSSCNSNNAATGTLQYKKSSSSSWTTYGTISKNTSTTLTATFSESSSYTFRVTVKDSLGNSATSKEVLVSTISVLLDFRAGGLGLGIGKIAESDAMEVSMDAIFNNNITCGAGGYYKCTYLNEQAFTHIHPTTGYGVSLGVGTSGYNRGVYDRTNNSWIIYRDSDNTTVTVTSSDERLKDNLGEIPLEETLTLLNGIVPYNFIYKNSKTGIIHNGFMAQNVRDVLIDNNIGYRPYLIIGKDNYDLKTPEENTVYGLDYSMFTPLLLSGWQYHEEQLHKLEERISVLENTLMEKEI